MYNVLGSCFTSISSDSGWEAASWKDQKESEVLRELLLRTSEAREGEGRCLLLQAEEKMIKCRKMPQNSGASTFFTPPHPHHPPPKSPRGLRLSQGEREESESLRGVWGLAKRRQECGKRKLFFPRSEWVPTRNFHAGGSWTDKMRAKSFPFFCQIFQAPLLPREE